MPPPLDVSAVHESEAAPAPTDAAASDETATGGAAGEAITIELGCPRIKFAATAVTGEIW